MTQTGDAVNPRRSGKETLFRTIALAISGASLCQRFVSGDYAHGSIYFSRGFVPLSRCPRRVEIGFPTLAVVF
jgi:hypothetical protein